MVTMHFIVVTTIVHNNGSIVLTHYDKITTILGAQFLFGLLAAMIPTTPPAIPTPAHPTAPTIPPTIAPGINPTAPPANIPLAAPAAAQPNPPKAA